MALNSQFEEWLKVFIRSRSVVIWPNKKNCNFCYFMSYSHIFCFQVIQYIGEVCRYLLAQPYCPSERQNTVRVAFGNGLRPQIWKEFQSRFSIEHIGEFFGATEGNVGLFNTDNTPGSCGFVSVIVPGLVPLSLLKVDPSSGELLRGENGLAIPAGPGEPGLAAGKISKGSFSSS